MNLIDLVRRRDRAVLKMPEGLEPCLHKADNLAMHSLKLAAGAELQIGGFLAFDEMRSMPNDLGWSVARADDKHARPVTLRVAAVGANGERFDVAHAELRESTSTWRPLPLRWPARLKDVVQARLVIGVDETDTRRGASSGSVLLGISEALSLRQDLFEYARGNGIEIGPGMSPQVLPSKEVDVRYLEQYPLDKWMAMYGKKYAGNVPEQVRKLWDRYIVGDAQRLENIPDGSLDFIFSSHVFEHLVNPLGTLEVWHKKLRRGGHVLGVVPDANNCFDLRQPLSREEDWLGEWRSGTWTFQEHHYEKWVRYTAPDVTTASLRERGYAIHAHYYTPATFGRLLQLATEHLGYANYLVRSCRNSKDFVWLVQA